MGLGVDSIRYRNRIIPGINANTHTERHIMHLNITGLFYIIMAPYLISLAVSTGDTVSIIAAVSAAVAGVVLFFIKS